MGNAPWRDEAPLPPSRICVCNSSACAISTLHMNSNRSGALQCGVSRAGKKKIMHLPWPKHASRAMATLGVVAITTTTVVGVVRPKELVEPAHHSAGGRLGCGRFALILHAPNGRAVMSLSHFLCLDISQDDAAPSRWASRRKRIASSVVRWDDRSMAQGA